MKIIQKKTFSLIELLVTIAVIAILAGLLLPALNAAREKGRGIACSANLKQIGMFLLAYEDDNNGWGPDGINTNFHSDGNTFAQLWQDRLMYYYMPNVPVGHVHHAEIKDGIRKIRPIFVCPASGYAQSASTDTALLYRNYGINYHMAAHENPYRIPESGARFSMRCDRRQRRSSPIRHDGIRCRSPRHSYELRSECSRRFR